MKTTAFAFLATMLLSASAHAQVVMKISLPIAVCDLDNQARGTFLVDMNELTDTAKADKAAQFLFQELSAPAGTSTTVETLEAALDNRVLYGTANVKLDMTTTPETLKITGEFYAGYGPGTYEVTLQNLPSSQKVKFKGTGPDDDGTMVTEEIDAVCLVRLP